MVYACGHIGVCRSLDHIICEKKMADEEVSVQNVEMEVTEDSKDVTENKDQKPAEKDKDVLTFEGRTYDG